MDSFEDQTAFDTGEYIFHEGDPGECAYIIDSGMVEVSREKNGRKIIMATLTRGDIIGEMSIIDHQPRMASARAIEPTVVAPIPFDYARREIERADPTVRLFLQLLVARYRDLNKRLGQVFEKLSHAENSSGDEVVATGKKELKNVIDQFGEMHKRIDPAAVEPTQSDRNVTFSEETLELTKTLVAKERALKAAVANEEFCLYYQPILDLKKDQIVGCEALVRWEHPSGKILAPAHFINDAERSGLIVDLGYWIAKEACKFQRRLNDDFKCDLAMNINLSGKQFEDQSLVPNLIDIMDNAGVQHEKIKYEITESLLIGNPELASSSLNNLKEAGSKLAIDDFGTGYSSFSYLYQFPFDTLKIDRAFVGSMERREKSVRIVKSLINLSHDLGMDVVAEGVESEQIAELLRSYKTSCAQGYHFSPPVNEAEFVNLLSSSKLSGCSKTLGQASSISNPVYASPSQYKH